MSGVNGKSGYHGRLGRSGYHGVTWSNSIKRWVARISYSGAARYLGTFDSAEDAARAYDKEAKRVGKRAYLNFPGE